MAVSSIGHRVRRPAWIASVLAIAMLTLLAAAQSASARSRLPVGFIGVNVDPNLRDVNAPSEFNTMVGAGVESLRVLFAWDQAQPYPSFAGLKPGAARHFRNIGGVPTDFSQSDRMVLLAASRGITLLPVIEYAPPWASSRPGFGSSPPSPAGYSAYAAYVRALVARYGPRGSFWREHRRLHRSPIRQWQIWNEPDLPGYWDSSNWPPEYVALLRMVRPALRSADPGARLVLAGLSNDSWSALQQIYNLGGGGLFDVTDVHPYTHYVNGLADIAGLFRQVMNRNGDGGKPMIVGEFSWPSGLGITPSYNLAVTPRQQAGRVHGALQMLVAQRQRLGISGIYWYTWISPDTGKDDLFSYAGLRRLNTRTHRGVAKPAFGAFRHTALALEGCKRKGSRVGDCKR